MVRNKICRGRAIRIAVGITTLVLLMAGGAEALSDLKITPHSGINNSFIMYRLDAGITSHRGLGMPFKNATGEFTSKGLKNESGYGRIPENKNLLPVRSIEKAAVMISANSVWFINDNATGGDCISIGTWNALSKTCTLTMDLNKTIEIDSDSITLDGNGHTITGNSSEYGFYLSGLSGVTIKNTNVRSFNDGIYLYSSSNITLIGNNASNNNDGINLRYSSNNTLSGNDANLNKYDGIDLYYSSNNTLSGNNASSNKYDGIYLYYSSNSTLIGNNASNNGVGIGLSDSSNNALSGNNASNNDDGINLRYSSNNTLGGNNAPNNDDGIYLYFSSNNTLTGNNASNNSYGIYLYSSSVNTLTGNNASNNSYGIFLGYSSNITLTGNNASNNSYGIYLGYSSNFNMLFNNTMTANSFNFGIYGLSDSDFGNQIDYSNTVDGKPIYYVNYANNTVYDSSTNAGIFYCISCINVTIKDIELTKNEVGIFFWNTTSSKIQNVTVPNNHNGIYLLKSSNNTLSGNNVNSNNDDGIYLYSSSNNTLSGNNANSNNDDGIYLYSSSNNTLSGNNANNNSYGISLYSSSDNTLTGNNASNNSYGIFLGYSSNITLTGNNASNNSYGIYLSYSSNYNMLFNNTMTVNSFNFGIYGLSDSDFSNHIDYSNTVDGKPIYYVNYANNTVYDSSTNAGIFYCISCINVTIKDIELIKNEVGIFFWNTTSSKIQNVTVSNNHNGIYLLESSNNTLSGNNVNSNNDDGIYLYSSSNNTLNGNNASNNPNGIYLYSSSNNKLSGNDANSNNYDGIYLHYSCNSTLIGNNASNNDVGIVLFGSSHNTLIGNNASNNSYGIVLFESSNSTLSGNNASNNDIGIDLLESSNNTLSRNNASNNYYGIYLGDSSNNNIYNNLFNNTNNSYMDKSVNIWNINKTPGTNIIGGSYLGGNLWANPSGTGFSQTCADADQDEICDTPYSLDSYNFDYLPLAYDITQTLVNSYLPPGGSPAERKAGLIRAMDDYFYNGSLTKPELLSVLDAYFA